jgi:hypothetical protein
MFRTFAIVAMSLACVLPSARVFTKTKIALSIALALSTASGAMAATKYHAHRHQTAVATQVSAADDQSWMFTPSKGPSKFLGFVGHPGTVHVPMNFYLQSYAP